MPNPSYRASIVDKFTRQAVPFNRERAGEFIGMDLLRESFHVCAALAAVRY